MLRVNLTSFKESGLAYFGFSSRLAPANSKAVCKIFSTSSSDENSTRAVPQNKFLFAT